MERNIIIENICTACRCGERRAEEYLAAELRNLRELRDAGALCYGDLETACSGLGLDFDYTDYFCRDRKSTRLNSSHRSQSRMPSSA